MLKALNNNQLVLARDADDKAKYTCPKCGKSVVLKKGVHRQPYFAHARNLTNLTIEPESKAHKAGKQAIVNDLLELGQNPQVEVVLDNRVQRADVLIAKNKRVVEYQCSQLSLAQCQRRTAEYHDSGYGVWWILGDTYLHRRLTFATIQKFARFTANYGFYLVFYSVAKSEYVVWTQIEEANGIYTYRTFNRKTLGAIVNVIKRTHQLAPTPAQRRREVMREVNRIFCGVNLKNERYIELVNLCYLEQKGLNGAPILCHSPRRRFLPIFRNSGFEFRVRLILKIFSDQNQFLNAAALNKLYHSVADHCCEPLIQVRDAEGFYVLEFRKLISDLRTDGYLKYSYDGVKIVNQPRWYLDYDHKRIAIERI